MPWATGTNLSSAFKLLLWPRSVAMSRPGTHGGMFSLFYLTFPNNFAPALQIPISKMILFHGPSQPWIVKNSSSLTREFSLHSILRSHMSVRSFLAIYWAGHISVKGHSISFPYNYLRHHCIFLNTTQNGERRVYLPKFCSSTDHPMGWDNLFLRPYSWEYPLVVPSAICISLPYFNFPQWKEN